jgi:hypothetical protein
MFARHALNFALAGVAAATLWSLQRQAAERRQKRALKPKQPALSTWEGEGGALPKTGSQMGPSPTHTFPANQPSNPVSGL